MTLTLIDYDGLLCPTFRCDHCGEPIQARAGQPTADGEPTMSGDPAVSGWVLWDMALDPQSLPLYFVHSRCDRPFSAGRPHLASRELAVFVAQLANNTELGFPLAHSQEAR